MRFLFRVAFWLTVIILLLSSDPESGPDARQVTLMQAVTAIRATITDMSHFCERNPDLCATGEAVVQVVADKARYGIELVQDYLGRNSVGEDTLTAGDAGVPWLGSAGASMVAEGGSP